MSRLNHSLRNAFRRCRQNLRAAPLVLAVTACEPVVKSAQPANRSSPSVVDTADSDAVAENFLAGKKAFVKGSLITGSATDQGALNLNTTPIPASSNGFYTSITLTLTSSSVCAGTSIFGSSGTALCNSVFSDLTASNMNRDRATAQISLSTEKNTSYYSAGYREVPNVFKDDDGFYSNASLGCNGTGGAYDTCTSIVFATRPASDCGTSGSVSARITNCATLNGSDATWDGSVKGTNGEAVWKLVARKNGAEVWRDERTKLLWSDADSGSYNWCQASGSKQSDDPSNFCNNPSYQNQTNPYSVCAEFAGAQSPVAGDNYSVANTYADSKGGMGAFSPNPVRWRLPVRNDFLQAEIDGIRYVIPNFYNIFWSATIQSVSRDSAWVFYGSDGLMGSVIRTDNNNQVRCVGR